MARSTAKLRAVETSPSPLRAPLADALAAVEEIKAAIAANEAAQNEARQKVAELEAALEDKKRALEHVPALERRPLRAAIAELEETVRDYRDHAEELRMAAADGVSGLRSQLEDAELAVKAARRELLRNHPHVVALQRRLADLRAETAQITADLSALAAIGGVEEGWASSSAPNPAPSPALAAWIAALLTDANAEISNGDP